MVSVTGSDVTSVSPSCDAVATTVNVPSPRSGSGGSSVIDQAPVVSSISVYIFLIHYLLVWINVPFQDPGSAVPLTTKSLSQSVIVSGWVMTAGP